MSLIAAQSPFVSVSLQSIRKADARKKYNIKQVGWSLQAARQQSLELLGPPSRELEAFAQAVLATRARARLIHVQQVARGLCWPGRLRRAGGEDDRDGGGAQLGLELGRVGQEVPATTGARGQLLDTSEMRTVWAPAGGHGRLGFRCLPVEDAEADGDGGGAGDGGEWRAWVRGGDGLADGAAGVDVVVGFRKDDCIAWNLISVGVWACLLSGAGLTFLERARAREHGRVEHPAVIVEAHNVQVHNERRLAGLDQELL